MFEHDALRVVLQTKAQEISSLLDLPMQIGDEAFVQPKGTPWAEFWFRTGTTKQRELGGPGSLELTPGILQFTIYAPQNTGDGPPLRLAGAIKKALNRRQWRVPPDGYVTLDPVGVEQVPGIQKGFKVCVVDCSFDFHHSDPDAPPFDAI